ncbi:CXXC-type zinc finger protein 1-like isoform X2 [Drosophila gunungcola]|uniref:CXXC-type zinc finger protein 1-like isoform X2 n=1 Tax=Drosophila gunungcola TaxID=103775 RepID=UPI0022E01E10|nr:CXXC-type zinc finger protein 1-like isoform X2 [Drosophila gunungcola]
MPVVHRRIIAEDSDPMTIPTELYCICRQSHANGFMICCDNCNEWFHGACIGVTDEKGHTYDSFYCKRCRLRNSRLRCTFKSNPINPAVPKEDPKEVYKPKTSRVINSAGVRQRPPITRRKSMFCLSATHNLEMESALPEKSKAKTPAAVTKNPKQGSKASSAEIQKRAAKEMELEVATNIDPKAIEAARTTDPKSVKKTYETKETQCNLFRELATEAIDDQNPPGKSGERGICFANSCNVKARPDSRYCSDECGNFTALTRVFSFAPQFVPAWALGCDGSRPKDLMVVSTSQHNMLTENESENRDVSRESSQPTELERKAESEAKRAKEDVRGKIDYSSRRKSRSSRYHSPKSVNNTDIRHSPAKKKTNPGRFNLS